VATKKKRHLVLSNTPECQAAREILILVAERNGPTMMARIGVMRATSPDIQTTCMNDAFRRSRCTFGIPDRRTDSLRIRCRHLNLWHAHGAWVMELIRPAQLSDCHSQALRSLRWRCLLKQGVSALANCRVLVR
jgi:hypothetical protein